MTYSQYTELVNTVKSHDYHYFVENRPQITDEEYDRLYFQLQDYEQQHPEQVLSDSPTQCAHAEVKNGHRQIRRRTPMLSTEKAQTVEKVEKWMAKTSKQTGEELYTVEWKYDGVSCSLVYQDGELIEASYGKGIEGNDCLKHCLVNPTIPNTINRHERVEVRGEMVCHWQNFGILDYKNPRSTAAGILADTTTYGAELLCFYPYWWSRGPLCFLEGIGFTAFDGVRISTISPSEIESVVEQCERQRDTLPFPTDGLVIKVADMNKWDSLGATEHHPKYAIAYKFAAATAETTITRIEITTGVTGKRTPVAHFEPVTINGATYQKASVGSEAKLQELGLQVGSKVVVSLRNDVVPHIDGLSSTPSSVTPTPFIGEDESGENSEIEETKTENEKSETGNTKVKRFAKFAAKCLACVVAVAGIVCVAYCAIGLVFFLPLLLKK